LYDLPQILHGDRARRAHPKRIYPFLDLIHSFSARGQNVDFWLLSKNNTSRLPFCGNPAGINQKTEHNQLKLTTHKKGP